MKDSKQMELIPSTLLQEDTLANLSPSLDLKKVKKIRDTSGQSILDLSKNVGRLGLLEKTFLDTLNSVSTPLSRTWRVKTTPLGRLVFQLRASVPTTKEKESGLWLTPSATTISTRSKESMEKRKKYRESIGRTTVPPGNLAEQVQHGHKATHMWSTPTAFDRYNIQKPRKKHPGGGQKPPLCQQVMWPTPTSGRITQEMSPSQEKRNSLNLAQTVQVREGLWPTPTARDHKDTGVNTNYEKAKKKGRLAGHAGGTLNPTWVEWLMGYPSGWTDLKD